MNCEGEGLLSIFFMAFLAGFFVPGGVAPCTAQTLFEASGATATDIQLTVDSFRAALGANNGNSLGPLPGGRREVNWDGTPSEFLDPFPGDFFNTNVTRGIEFSSPDATRLKVSGDEGSGSFEFEDVTAVIPTLGLPWGPIELASFSPQKIFAPLDSIITDIHFFVPGTAIPATVNSFGTVLVDVDLANTSLLEIFGPNNQLLFSRHVSTSGVQSEGLSFMGVILSNGQVATHVRITSGNMPINTAFLDPPPDGVAIDDVIYSEPQPIPETGTMALALFGLITMLGTGRLRRPSAWIPT